MYIIIHGIPMDSSGAIREVIVRNPDDGIPLRFKCLTEAHSYAHRHNLYTLKVNTRVVVETKDHESYREAIRDWRKEESDSGNI